MKARKVTWLKIYNVHSPFPCITAILSCHGARICKSNFYLLRRDKLRLCGLPDVPPEVRYFGKSARPAVTAARQTRSHDSPAALAANVTSGMPNVIRSRDAESSGIRACGNRTRIRRSILYGSCLPDN